MEMKSSKEPVFLVSTRWVIPSLKKGDLFIYFSTLIVSILITAIYLNNYVEIPVVVIVDPAILHLQLAGSLDVWQWLQEEKSFLPE